MNKTDLSRREFMIAGAMTVAGTTLLGLPGCGSSSSSLSGGDIDEYVLKVGYLEQTVGGVRIRTRTYNGGIPGPTIRTAQGRHLRVTVQNNLPPNPPAPAESTIVAEQINNPHEFNTTNIHYHGLNVEAHLFEPLGTSNPNAPMIMIEPGTSLTYDLHIPHDHPAGLHWYHAHHHGSTAVQSFSGMAGLIVIEGPIDRVPEIAAANQYFVAVQSLRLDPDKTDPNLFVMEPIAFKRPTDGGFKTNSFTKTIYTVNGHAVAWKGPAESAPNQQLGVQSITARPGEVIRIRMLNGCDEQFMPVRLEGHTMHLIGYDGVNLPSLIPLDTTELAPANRFEFLVKCGAPGTYAFRHLPVIGEQFESSTGMVLMNLEVVGDPIAMALPTRLPVAMEPIAPREINGNPNRIAFHTQFPFPEHPELLTGVGMMINGQLYAETRIDHTSRLNTAEEWTVSASEVEGHPLHVHMNPFQVVEIDGVPVDPPIFKDTVWVKKSTTVKLRMRFENYAGKTVYHCHILIHEDTGMMSNFMIVP